MDPVHDPYALSSQANSGNSYVINPDKLHRIRRANTRFQFLKQLSTK